MASTTAFAECPSGSVPVFIVAGQSNAVGYAEVSDLPPEYRYLTEIDPNVLTWNDRTKVVEPLAIGRNNTMPAERLGSFGPEAMIASQLRMNSGSPFILFKYAVSGTSLESDWNSERDGSLYYRLLFATYDLDRALAQNGQTACYRAFFWMQGESDLSEWNRSRYQRNFENFKERLRVALGVMTLPFYLGRIASPPTPEFDAVQDRIALADPLVRIIETRDLSKLSDDIHFDARGQVELGLRFYQSYSSMNWNGACPRARTLLHRP